jgi:hypothetical protein
VNRIPFFADRQHLQLTGRELRTRINWPDKVFLTLGLIVLCTFSGPFGTYLELSLFWRIVYWSFAIAGVGLCLNAGWIIALDSPHLARLAPVWRFVIGLTAAAPLAGMLVLGLELLLRTHQTRPTLYPQVTAFVWLTGLAVGLMEYRRELWPPLAGGEQEQGKQPSPPPAAIAPPPQQPQQPPQQPQPQPHAAFFDRLSPALGRDLVSLSIRDHYLEVVTSRGRDLIHLRMGDAVSELRGYDGFQVHRSHWIAAPAMVRLKRRGSSHFVMLTDGRNIPVSRPNVEKVRALLDARPRRLG